MKNNIIFIFFLCSHLISFSGENTTFENSTLATENFDSALFDLDTSNEKSEIYRSLNEIEKFNISEERNVKASEWLDDVIVYYPDDDALYNEIKLIKTLLTSRNGKKDDAYQTFEKLIQEKCSKSSYKKYFDCIWENADDALAAKKEYHFQISHERDDDFRKFYGMKNNLIRFFYYTRGLKYVSKIERPAMNEVIPYLESPNSKKYISDIANSLCYASDGSYDEAADVMNQVYVTLKKEDDLDYWKDIPLYFASIRFLEEKDISAGQELFEEFLERNSDEPDRILNYSIELCDIIGLQPPEKSKMFYLTDTLLKSDFYKNSESEFVDQFKEQIATIKYKHLLSLAWRGEHDEAMEISFDVMNKYYPDTTGGANAALCYASFIISKRRNEAIYILESILNEPPNERIITFVKSVLASDCFRRGFMEDAKKLIDDILVRAGKNPQEEFYRAYYKAKKMESMLHRFDDESNHLFHGQERSARMNRTRNRN